MTIDQLDEAGGLISEIRTFEGAILLAQKGPASLTFGSTAAEAVTIKVRHEDAVPLLNTFIERRWVRLLELGVERPE
jgi:hypothetical protein